MDEPTRRYLQAVVDAYNNPHFDGYRMLEDLDRAIQAAENYLEATPEVLMVEKPADYLPSNDPDFAAVGLLTHQTCEEPMCRLRVTRIRYWGWVHLRIDNTPVWKWHPALPKIER